MKIVTPRLAAIAAFACSLALSAPAAESLSLLLQKGIYVEETEGNLESAIKIYEQIAAESAANRTLAAQAQFRLAVCYQKLGKKEAAVKVLEDLVQDPLAGPMIIERCRQLLTQLGQAPRSPRNMAKVFVPEGAPLSVSSDGRFVAYRPTGNSQAIAIHDLVANRSWTLPKQEKYTRDLIFSRDGRRIAFTSDGVVFVADLDGSNAEAIHRYQETVSLLGWTADPNKLVVLPWETSPLHVKSLDITAKSLTEISALPEDMFFDGLASSDGRYVTNRSLGPGKGRGTISLIDVATGHHSKRIESDLLAVVGFSPKDNRLLFTSHRTGTVDLWSIAVKGGEMTGDAQLVASNVGAAAFETPTIAGDLFYWQDVKASNIYVAGVNLDSGEVTSAPRPITERFRGAQVSPKWSHDGGSLMFVAESQPRRFVTVSIANGDFREFPIGRAFTWPVDHFTWSATKNVTYVQSLTSETDWGIHRFDLKSGATDPFLMDDKAEHIQYYQPQISADGQLITYVEYQKRTEGSGVTNVRIMQKDFRTGQTTKLYDAAEPFNRWMTIIRVSPDTKRVAWSSWQKRSDDANAWDGGIKIITLADGSVREISSSQSINSMEWTADSAKLVFVKGSRGSRPAMADSQIWIANADSGQTTRLQYANLNIGDLAIHPSGRQIAFRMGALIDASELWVMRGFVDQNSQEPPKSSKVTSILNQIGEVNGRISDREFKVSAQLPAGWSIRSATRGEYGVTVIQFDVPGARDASVRLVYRRFSGGDTVPTESALGWINAAGSIPDSLADVDAWLKKFITIRSTNQTRTYPDFKLRPESLAARTIAQHPAMSALADYTNNGARWVSYSETVCSPDSKLLPALGINAPADVFENFRPALEQLIQTLRFP